MQFIYDLFQFVNIYLLFTHSNGMKFKRPERHSMICWSHCLQIFVAYNFTAEIKLPVSFICWLNEGPGLVLGLNSLSSLDIRINMVRNDFEFGPWILTMFELDSENKLYYVCKSDWVHHNPWTGLKFCLDIRPFGGGVRSRFDLYIPVLHSILFRYSQRFISGFDHCYRCCVHSYALFCSCIYLFSVFFQSSHFDSFCN